MGIIKFIIDRFSWCVVDIDGQEIRARIVHKGKGKFRMEGDADGAMREQS